jgi:hypothetical protein
MGETRISPNLDDHPKIVRAMTAIVTTLVLALSITVTAAAPSALAASTCGLTINPIVCENSKPGTSPAIWDIDGAGDDSIQGFSTDISVNVGSTIGFKVDTDASAYTITIFRTGWYQGLGARQIATVTPSARLPQIQPQCVSDATTELYDCGNWGLSASWDVPADAVSGVYIALLHRNDRDDSSHITFIVRNQASQSPVLFQTSDPTWQAYNTYGGSDFYQGAANGRAYKISYNRPVATRGPYLGRDFYFANEYPMVRFLEKNGYDVSYFSGVDTDRFGSTLTNHKVFLSVGHDEYWSTGQRANVEAARNAGVNLQFLSGNEVYWHTRYESSVAGTSTSYRTIVSYKETWNNQKIDPSPTWTGTWRDPRFASQANGAGIPENALTGTMYQSNFSDLPVKVSATEGKTRLWRNTSLASLPAGSTASLAPHTIGYESNEDVDNGFRPAGIIRLSTTTGAVPQYMQDFGNTVAEGTTTHHLTLYRAPSGALVFSAGSVQWTWGLDQTHDGDGAAADVRMQQAEVNLLADMGAQPATRASNLVAATASTDRTAPATTITSPAQGAAIANGTRVTITGTATDSAGKVAGVEVSTDGGTSWRAATGTTAWTYSYIQQGTGAVPIKARAIDDSANYSSTPATVTVQVGGPFTVFGQETPAIVDSGDTQPVELGLRFTPSIDGYISGVRFYKSTANTGIHTGSLWSAAGVRLANVTFTGESASGWQTASFATPVAVTAGQNYVVSYSDPGGHYAATSFAWSYRGRTAAPLTVAGGFGSQPAGVYNTSVGAFPTDSYNQSNYYVDAVFTTTDASPLVASSQWPLPGSSSVPATTTISAVLSKNVTASMVSFTVVDQLGATVPGTTSYAATTRTATFTPTSALNGFVKYTVTLTAKDTGGVSLSAGGTWSFTTVKPATAEGVCPCGLFTDATVPTVLQAADAIPVTLGVHFTSSVAGQITGIRFYKAAGNTGTHTGTLWSSAGVALATATFSAESTSGWQTVTFTNPVTIAAGTDYVASYATTVGAYSLTPGAFDGAGVTRGPLTAGNAAGAFSYQGGFPGSRSTSNYLVDVVFMSAPSSISLVSTAPANGSTAVDPGTAISVTVSAALAPGYSLTATANGTAIAGVTSLSSDGKTVTLTPNAPLPNSATVVAKLMNATSTTGASLPTTSWSFTTMTGAPADTFTVLGNAVPAVVAATDDAAAVELGMSFSTSQPGKVTAIRFYKGATNTGTHKGSLWSASGARLAQITFTGESATGWQTAQLSTPVTLTVGTTYVVSYLAPRGNYSYTSAYFAQPKTSGPLTAGSTNNGRYFYGATGGFPSYSWNASNYFVDVVFLPDAVAPPVTPPVTPPPTDPPPSDPPTTPPATATSIFPSDAIPANASWPEGGPIQVGVRFTSAKAGTITSIRFYKGPGNTGTHEVYLWTAAGQQLGTATAVDETADGWQTATFTTPISIAAGVEYRATYLAPVGRYAVDLNGLATAITSGPLSTPASGGTYSYGTGAPTGTAPHNYWVDVNFIPASP